MIIADENLEKFWVELLRGKGYEVLWIAEEFRGVSDRFIVDLVRNILRC